MYCEHCGTDGHCCVCGGYYDRKAKRAGVHAGIAAVALLAAVFLAALAWAVQHTRWH